MVQVTAPTAAGYLGSGDSAITSTQQVVPSEMLTVWRELHVEIDSMPAMPTVVETPDNVSFTTANSLGAGQLDKVFVAGSSFSGTDNFYKGGLLKLSSGMAFEITGSSNAGSTFTGITLTLNRALTAAEIAALPAGGIVLDDDGRYMPPSMGAPLPRYDLISDPFIATYAAACIQVKHTPALNPNKLIPWDAYEGPNLRFFAEFSG